MEQEQNVSQSIIDMIEAQDGQDESVQDEPVQYTQQDESNNRGQAVREVKQQAVRQQYEAGKMKTTEKLSKIEQENLKLKQELESFRTD